MDTVLNLCTPDVRWLVPGRPVLEGREAGRQLLQAPRVKLLALRASDVRVEQSGDLACKTSRYEARYRTAEQEKVSRGHPPLDSTPGQGSVAGGAGDVAGGGVTSGGSLPNKRMQLPALPSKNVGFRAN